MNSPGINVPDGPHQASVAIDVTGKCYVAFTGISGDVPQGLVYFITIEPDGRIGKAPQAVTPPHSGFPSLVQSSDSLHLTWLEKVEKKKFRVGYRRSLDRGEHWSEPVYIDAGRSSRPPLLREGPGGILLLFLVSDAGDGQLERLWCRSSSDQGVSWQSSRPQGENPGAPSDPFPFTDSKGICLTWTERRTDAVSVMFNRSTDGGRTWLAPIAVVSNRRQLMAASQLIRSADGLATFWIQQTDEGQRLYMSSSGDDGVSWGPPSEIDIEGVSQLTYQVVGDAHNAHVVTVEQKGAGRYRTFDLEVRRLDLRALSSERSGVNTEKVWSNSYLFEPDCRAVIRGQMLLTAAVVRSSIHSWSLILLSSDRSSNSTNIVQIAPEAGGKSRSLVALTNLPDTVGVFYREQEARRLPMGVLPGDLYFARVPVSNQFE